MYIVSLMCSKQHLIANYSQLPRIHIIIIMVIFQVADVNEGISHISMEKNRTFLTWSGNSLQPCQVSATTVKKEKSKKHLNTKKKAFSLRIVLYSCLPIFILFWRIIYVENKFSTLIHWSHPCSMRWHWNLWLIFMWNTFSLLLPSLIARIVRLCELHHINILTLALSLSLIAPLAHKIFNKKSLFPVGDVL